MKILYIKSWVKIMGEIIQQKKKKKVMSEFGISFKF